MLKNGFTYNIQFQVLKIRFSGALDSNFSRGFLDSKLKARGGVDFKLDSRGFPICFLDSSLGIDSNFKSPF